MLDHKVEHKKDNQVSRVGLVLGCDLDWGLEWLVVKSEVTVSNAQNWGGVFT